MKLYVYCLADDLETLPMPVGGVSGATVNLIRCEDFSFLVSDYEGDSPLSVTRDNVMAHAAVVQSLLNQTTPLPFRFGTIVSEERLRNYVTAQREELKTKLAQVRGCVEMSVKIICSTNETDVDAEVPEEGPGARFLKEKRREILGGERRAEEARQIATWLHEQVQPLAKEEAVSLSPTEKLIVAAAHLVLREQVPTYRERLTAARKSRTELHFLVSGPWPPYTFSESCLVKGP